MSSSSPFPPRPQASKTHRSSLAPIWAATHVRPYGSTAKEVQSDSKLKTWVLVHEPSILLDTTRELASLAAMWGFLLRSTPRWMSDPDRPVSSLVQDDADAQDEVEGLHVDRMTSPLAFS